MYLCDSGLRRGATPTPENDSITPTPSSSSVGLARGGIAGRATPPAWSRKPKRKTRLRACSEVEAPRPRAHRPPAACEHAAHDELHGRAAVGGAGREALGRRPRRERQPHGDGQQHARGDGVRRLHVLRMQLQLATRGHLHPQLLDEVRPRVEHGQRQPLAEQHAGAQVGGELRRAQPQRGVGLRGRGAEAELPRRARAEAHATVWVPAVSASGVRSAPPLYMSLAQHAVDGEAVHAVLEQVVAVRGDAQVAEQEGLGLEHHHRVHPLHVLVPVHGVELHADAARRVRPRL